jgi:hypothetical protein
LNNVFLLVLKALEPEFGKKGGLQIDTGTGGGFGFGCGFFCSLFLYCSHLVQQFLALNKANEVNALVKQRGTGSDAFDLDLVSSVSGSAVRAVRSKRQANLARAARFIERK